MKKCKKCGKDLPNRIYSEGKVFRMQTRKFCLECSPFGRHNTKDLTESEEDTEEILRKRRRKQQTRYVKERRREFKKKGIDYLGGKCSVCGYDKCLMALEFHHINPGDKKFTLSWQSYRMSWDKVKEELDKCIILCANCHRELHSEDILGE